MKGGNVDEATIRDEIARRPALVEVGMTTIATNYHLPNSEGTRGFIDVLARDRNGLYVVVEVKRSESTAREAIHEVIKYCELLRAERGLRNDQVRAIIASSKWRELLVPFSEMSRVSNYPIEGINLIVDADFPSSLRAKPVTPLPLPAERDLSTVALRFELQSPTDAANRWPDIVQQLTAVGFDDAIGIVIGNKTRCLLHVALGTLVPGDPRIPSDLDGYAEDLGEEPEEYQTELLAAGRLIDQMPDAELVSPERLGRIMDTNQLNLIEVLRSGRFEVQSELVDDDEALRLAEGSWNQVMVTMSGRPSHVPAWRRLRSRLDYTLFGNPRWKRLLGLWLDEVEQSHPTADVVLHVYNPRDLMASLVHGGMGGGLARLLPQVEGALDVSGEDGRLLQGVLTWDGTSADSAVSAIESVYRSPGDWGIARASGGVWECDLRLLEALGLRYELFEFGPGDDTAAWRLNEQNDVLTRESASGSLEWAGCQPFPEWLRSVDLRALLHQYRSMMVPVDGGDQWLVVEGPREKPKP